MAKNRMEIVTKDTEFWVGDIIIIRDITGHPCWFNGYFWFGYSNVPTSTENLFANHTPVYRIFKVPRPKVAKVDKPKVEEKPKFPIEVNGFFIYTDFQDIRVCRGQTSIKLQKSTDPSKLNKVFIRSGGTMTIGNTGALIAESRLIVDS